MKQFYRYKLHHILPWLAYFAFWTTVSMNMYHTPFRYALLATFIWFIGQAGLIYCCVYWLVPRYLSARRYGLFAGWGLAALLLCSGFISVTALAMFRYFMDGLSLSLMAFFGYNTL